jgi:hypothetical protein
MTKREVEAEVEEIQTVTRKEEVYLCDACTREIDDSDSVYKFYSFDDRIESFHLCDSCTESPATSIS